MNGPDLSGSNSSQPFSENNKRKKTPQCWKSKKIIFKSFKWSTEMPLEGLDVERQILKIIPSCRPDQKQQKEKNEGKGKKRAWIKASPDETEKSPTIITLAVIFSPSHDVWESETANQCPGKLFIPALSLIHLYYSDRWLQRTDGWTHRVLQAAGAEAIQWEDCRTPATAQVEKRLRNIIS